MYELSPQHQSHHFKLQQYVTPLLVESIYLPEQQSPQHIHKAIVRTWSIIRRLFLERAGIIFNGNNVRTFSSTPITLFQIAVCNFGYKVTITTTCIKITQTVLSGNESCKNPIYYSLYMSILFVYPRKPCAYQENEPSDTV